MLTGPLGLLALQAPWYKLNDDHDHSHMAQTSRQKKLITERIRFILKTKDCMQTAKK